MRAMRALRTAVVTVAAVATLALSTPGAAGRATSAQQSPPPVVKVFISVDMEGLAGVVSGATSARPVPIIGHFRAIMAAETNAAIDGAFAPAPPTCVVRDSHGSKTNLVPGDLSPRAGW